jgi:hypothetical protein
MAGQKKKKSVFGDGRSQSSSRRPIRDRSKHLDADGRVALPAVAKLRPLFQSRALLRARAAGSLNISA